MELSVIQSKIYEIRGIKVMLDRDLAEMYQVETRVLNQAVKRNIERFPDDFMFQITSQEWESMSSQFVMTYPTKRPKSALPYAFTELGVAMLSSVLNSKTAIQINIGVMRAFVAVRQLLTAPPTNEANRLQNEVKELKEYIEEVFADYNDMHEDTRMQLDLINEALAELQTKHKYVNKPRNPVGYVKPKER
jgi:hypothetical protein